MEAEFRKSPELRAVVMRWMDAMSEREYAVAANLFLRSDHFRYIGSDAHEWWDGVAPIDAYEQHQNEMPPYVIEVKEVEAFESGEIGWAAVSTVTTFEGFEPRQLRWTMVFLLDEGIWRMVQIHDSMAVPNPEVMGIEMTTSLEDLLAAIGLGENEALRGAMRKGTVTLLFTDIEGSTELTAAVGDEAWAAAVEWHDAAIKEVVEQAGGTLVKTLGDGAMAAFNSVRDAARAANAIQQRMKGRTEDPQLAVRIGLHVGDAVFSEGDFLGTTVNKAARVAAAAAGGQVMVSTSVRALLEDDPEFRFGPPHSVELKGIPGVQEIVELLEGDPSPGPGGAGR